MMVTSQIYTKQVGDMAFFFVLYDFLCSQDILETERESNIKIFLMSRVKYMHISAYKQVSYSKGS